MHLAELNISELRAPIDSAQLRDFAANVDTINARSDRTKIETQACQILKKMGVKAHSAVLTFLPLLVLALKRAPGADGGQSPQKEVYS